MNSGVYVILNTTNNKRYVGSSVDLGKRFRVHRLALNRGAHHSIALQRAWDKYGPAAFDFIRLLICHPKDVLFYEQLCMNALFPEYNVSTVAGSQLGLKRSAETREKIRVMALGNVNSKGHIQSSEHRAKIANALVGNTNTLGYRHTTEARRKISEANRRRRLADKGTAATVDLNSARKWAQEPAR